MSAEPRAELEVAEAQVAGLLGLRILHGTQELWLTRAEAEELRRLLEDYTGRWIQ